MKQPLYALKDVKSGFRAPFIQVNDALAIRGIKGVLQEKNEVSQNPEDFEIWRVGSIDTDTGILESELVHVCNVQALIDVHA